MDLLFTHEQKKLDKRYDSHSEYRMTLYSDDNNIEFHSNFHFDYNRYGSRKIIEFVHSFNIEINTGDFTVTYKIINDNLTEDKMFRNTFKQKKNDFKLLFDLTENGFVRGEKRKGYWGVKYNRMTSKMIEIIFEKLKDKIKLDSIKNKNYNEKYEINSLYDLLVDYHLDVKGIKGHDSVYHDIQNDYPKKKYLEKNDYKFLPSVLDYYGIKSKYLVSELNKNWGKPINIGSLNYLCKLFGENYLDYIKQIIWEYHCFDVPPNKKMHELKNESEKKCMVSVIQKWEKDTLKSDSLIYSLNKLFSIRELLENRGLQLKFKAKNDADFENTLEMWSGIKFHFARGYRVKYEISEDFIKMIEDDIVIDGVTYKPKMILTEEEFRIEGYTMKNCMGKQFPHGVIYLYVALQTGRKRINLQYKKGMLVQSYGKANTVVPEDVFGKATHILTDRFKTEPNIMWKKEKYDFITNSFPTGYN
jgi:hypothetical protein